MDKEDVAVIVFIVVFFIGGGWLFVAAENAHQREANRFLAACEQDRKTYECEAMWRQGENHTQVVPVFIPTGK